MQRDFAVFNNGSALASQRLTELQQQRVAYDQLRRRATYEAASAIDRYERARGFAAEVDQEAKEAPREELTQVLGQFEAGNADILNVLAVQNNLLQELRSHLDLVNEVAQSAALVTQATAIPPERLFSLRPLYRANCAHRPAKRSVTDVGGGTVQQRNRRSVGNRGTYGQGACGATNA